MHGALTITFQDGTREHFEVEPVGDSDDFVDHLRTFVASPTVTLVLHDMLVVIPSTSIREISITHSASLPAAELQKIPGVLVGAKRILG